ncbi:polysaccharide deacetylase family protein [Herbiconiux sp. CPCC 203407]|uniref:Polysaccharide deacetylase family protein n=1 Tax=Herbiconiux oxytropis TaxID=2970915 RepID=A0AA42BWL2_9MICO|nr:polysaccharide deacetylase family protein [Herbiconiux oxytropis]MCS5722533.1 polysaccharide deacetylase family protein [Herbiconiux oxytropis]MCS5726473.1 polysaccharide deacetylase family protein [Herbiconiux oxytropis]
MSRTRTTPQRLGRRRRAGALASVLAVAALLAGCASIPPAPAGWAPREPAVPAVTVSGAATDIGEAAGAADPEPAPPTAAGLDVRLLFNADPAAAVGARWGEIPGNATFTGVVRSRVTDAIRSLEAATGVAYSPAADAPDLSPENRGCVAGSSTRPAAELVADPAHTPQGAAASVTVTCEVIAAVGTLLVEALRVTTASAGQVTADETTVYYADTMGSFVTTSDALISDDGLRTLLTETVQSLKVSAGALRPEMVQSVDDYPVEQLRSWFSLFSFAADGALVLHLTSEFTVPELDELGRLTRPDPLFVTLPPERAAALLSENGRLIQTALASGAAFTLPPGPTRGQEAVDCGLFACVAVTFDDGPGAHTEQILDDLDSRRAAATFYVQGYRSANNPSALARMQSTGHQIGNHTWDHPDLTKLTDEQIKAQLDRTSQAVQDATGSRPSTFRPPYGAVDERVLMQTDLPAILWTVDTNDWQLPDDPLLLDRAVQQPGPGSIVLLHDIHENTARLTPAVLDGLLGRGFTLVTVRQLLGTPAPHTTTTRG